MKIILIGGHPKGFQEPFHPKTVSGRILRKIVNEIDIKPIYFDLWKNEEDENSRILSIDVKNELNNFLKKKYKLISLGRYIEKALRDNGIDSKYLPHPASRDKKYVEVLREGLKNLYKK
jgi:hypothetical protein